MADDIRITNVAIGIEEVITTEIRISHIALLHEERKYQYLRLSDAAIMIEYIDVIPPVEYGPQAWAM